MISLEFFLSDPGKTQLLVVENFAHYPKRTFSLYRQEKRSGPCRRTFLPCLGKESPLKGEIQEISRNIPRWGVATVPSRPLAPPPQTHARKKKASVAMLDELLYGRVPAIKVIRGILNQKSPTVLLM